MHIIAFITETPSVRTILEHIDEPTSPLGISPARGPPARGEDPIEVDPDYDPTAQPEPEIEFDQRVLWQPACPSPSATGDEGQTARSPPR